MQLNSKNAKVKTSAYFSRKCETPLKRDEGAVVGRCAVRFLHLDFIPLLWRFTPFRPNFLANAGVFPQNLLVSKQRPHFLRCESGCKNHVFVLSATLITEDRHLGYPEGGGGSSAAQRGERLMLLVISPSVTPDWFLQHLAECLSTFQWPASLLASLSLSLCLTHTNTHTHMPTYGGTNTHVLVLPSLWGPFIISTYRR